MIVTWQSLIDRARMYVDDDHKGEQAWLTPAQWLALGNVEYQQIYRRLLRMGLVVPAITEIGLSGPTTAVTGVLAVIGVAEDLGTSMRIIPPAQPTHGRDPYWRGSSASLASPITWSAVGTSDSLAVSLDPAPDNLIAPVAAAPAVAATLDLSPTGGKFPDGVILPHLTTVLRMRATGPSTHSIRFLPDIFDSTPAYLIDVDPFYSDSSVYHFNSALHTTADFEGTFAGSSIMEVATPSLYPTAPWADSTSIQNDSLHPMLVFSGGAVASPAVPANYFIRYIPIPTVATAVTDTVDLPDPADERVVLGMARRAHLKDSGASALLERLLQEADQELSFRSFGALNGVLVRRTVRPLQHVNRSPVFGSPAWPGPSEWRFF
jgi:hypothetical protein